MLSVKSLAKQNYKNLLFPGLKRKQTFGISTHTIHFIEQNYSLWIGIRHLRVILIRAVSLL